MISIAVIEDENIIRQDILEYLKRYMVENDYSYQVKDFSSAESFFFSQVNSYDIILMDINLPGLNGYEAAKQLREKNNSSVIVFVTSLAQYAIKGYEVNALDFMIKPLTYYSFALKMRRAVNEIKRNIEETVVIKSKTQINIIKIKDIHYVEVSSHTVIYHTKLGNFFATGTMKKIEEQLTDYHFVLCNQCYLVNLRYVSSVEGMTVQVGKDELSISRPKRKEFMHSLNEYIAGHLGK